MGLSDKTAISSIYTYKTQNSLKFLKTGNVKVKESNSFEFKRFQKESFLTKKRKRSIMRQRLG